MVARRRSSKNALGGSTPRKRGDKYKTEGLNLPPGSPRLSKSPRHSKTGDRPPSVLSPRNIKLEPSISGTLLVPNKAAGHLDE